MTPATSAPAADAADASAPQPPRLLLVWDAPNIDMGLGAILGSRPTAAHRPRFDAIGRWLLAANDDLEAQLGHPVDPEATVFTNILPGGADVVRPWVEALRNVGFAVFAKPKLHDDSDVDPDLIDHILLRRDQGVLAGVVVASADGQNFRPLLEELAESIPVTVIGFQEHTTWALASSKITFIDLEEIPGAFREPLPRVNLDSLPDEGAWLPPLRSLRSLLD